MKENLTATIFSVKHFAIHDGDGIRTTVFFKGCPLHCIWCHNPEGLEKQYSLSFYKEKCKSCKTCATICPNHIFENGKHIINRDNCTVCGKCTAICPAGALEIHGKTYNTDEILQEILKDRDFYELSGGGVTLSGGECLMQPEFCLDLLKKLKKENIHTAVDTCGFASHETFEKIIPYTDVFLYDIKAFSEETHIRCTGKSNKIILENLIFLNSKGCNIEVRIPYVPGYNSEEMSAIAEFLKTLKNVKKITVLPYHNYSSSKYLSLDYEDRMPEKLPSEEEIKKVNALFDF